MAFLSPKTGRGFQRVAVSLATAKFSSFTTAGVASLTLPSWNHHQHDHHQHDHHPQQRNPRAVVPVYFFCEAKKAWKGRTGGVSVLSWLCLGFHWKVHVRDMYSNEFEWNISQTWSKPERRHTLQLELIDIFPTEQRTSTMMYHGAMGWSLRVFPFLPFVCPFLLPCLSCDGFCRIPFRLRFFLLISFYLFHSFPILFFSAAFIFLSSFCFSSCDFFPPASCILYQPVCIFIRRFCFPVWFCVLEWSQKEGRNKGKIDDKQLGMD